MRRAIVWRVIIGIAVVALIGWIANNTTWTEITVPLPPKGEAERNPFYAAQRFAEALGARTTWDRTLQLPAPDAVIVLSDWHWSLIESRRQALERWVESGGRLVVDATLSDVNDFERWSGIGRRYPDAATVADDDTDDNDSAAGGRCQELEQRGDASVMPGKTTYRLCDFHLGSSLVTAREPVWSLVDRIGMQALRVRVGRGHVTLLNGLPFARRALLEGDHGWLFVASTELRTGDSVHFLSESDHPGLLALTWQYGAPVVVSAAMVLVFGLWRGSVRFGPLAPVPDGARRSLAEQIRGSGHFAARHDGGDALHAACVRALEDAAARRLPGYRRLTEAERVAWLAQLTGDDRDRLNEAIHHASPRRDRHLADTIARLEAARRRIIETDAPLDRATASDSHLLSTSLRHGTS